MPEHVEGGRIIAATPEDFFLSWAERNPNTMVGEPLRFGVCSDVPFYRTSIVFDLESGLIILLGKCKWINFLKIPNLWIETYQTSRGKVYHILRKSVEQPCNMDLNSVHYEASLFDPDDTDGEQDAFEGFGDSEDR